MARRRSYNWKRFRSGGWKQRGAYKAMYRKGGGSIIFGLGGAAAGYLAPTIHPLQDTIMTAVAVLPGVLPVGRTVPWQIRRFASGYVIGRIAKGLLGGASTPGADFV